MGRHVGDVLGLSDERGHDWWAASAKLRKMPGVTRTPEQRLVLSGPSGERELMATSRYVRQEGTLVRLVVAFRDTEARERAERSRADLVSTVAHELRSPLTSVKGFTATLLAKWDRFNDEQKKIMLQTVNADADRVTRLISELLDVSRIDSGRLELHRQVVDLGAAVKRVFAGRVATGEPRRALPPAGRRRSAGDVAGPGQDGSGAGEPRGERAAARRGHGHGAGARDRSRGRGDRQRRG